MIGDAGLSEWNVVNHTDEGDVRELVLSREHGSDYYDVIRLTSKSFDAEEIDDVRDIGWHLTIYKNVEEEDHGGLGDFEEIHFHTDGNYKEIIGFLEDFLRGEDYLEETGITSRLKETVLSYVQ